VLLKNASVPNAGTGQWSLFPFWCSVSTGPLAPPARGRIFRIRTRMGGVPQRDLLAVTVVKSCIVRVHRCAAPLGMRPAWELRATSARPTELSPVRSPARWRLLKQSPHDRCRSCPIQ